MNAAEHKAEAERLAGVLTDPNVSQMTHDDVRTTLIAAQVHATLATLPDPAPVDTAADPLWDAPLYQAAALLERMAVGDEGEQRERTIARLVLGGWVTAPDIAVHAIHAARDAGGGNKTKAVAEAIRVLGIDTDAD